MGALSSDSGQNKTVHALRFILFVKQHQAVTLLRYFTVYCLYLTTVYQLHRL
jgi:hypothetical protein